MSSTAFSAIASAAFWSCAALFTYTYAGYPVLLWVISRLFAGDDTPAALADDALPSTSLLISAFNEEAVIEQRVRNALALDYPRERIEIVIASDGSSDSTAEIVRGYVPLGVRLFDYVQNRGKATVLNSVVPQLVGQILVFSDANTEMDPQALRRLVRWFEDPRVGAVSGRLVLKDKETGGNTDGLYWKYETFLKRCEGRLGALLGANGAIYAIRRELYTAIPPTTIDDFLIPLLARLGSNCRIAFDASATAFEETAPDARAEFHRRARFGAGGFEAISLLWRLLDPRRGWIAFTFTSHKILRWLCPFFGVGMLLACIALIRRPPYRELLIVQLAIYGASIAAVYSPATGKLWKPLRLAGLFTLMNVALMVGFLRWVRGSQGGTWRPARLMARNPAE